MDEFLTDEQQAEKAKGWLRENGVFLVAGIVLGLGVLFGWQSWETSQLQKSGEASVVWGQLIDAINSERYNEADETLQLLQDEYAGTPYLGQGRLAMARMYMDRNEAENAIDTLKLVVSSGGDQQMRRVAELRLAQIYLYLERFDDGLAILGSEDSTAFAPQFHDLRGDIYFAQGELEKSRDEYQLALLVDRAGVVDRTYVQMKLDDVLGSIAAMPVESVVEVAGADAAEPAADAAESE